ncbi:MAG: hypothetical protein IPM24_05435 [Bryobacterales bacterium]|nr:hypothetical protein [Bryobacterales bacterium]
MQSPSDVLRSLIRNPGEHLIRRWNWKAALFSASFRGLIFLATNWSAGRDAAIAASLAEFTYRSFTAGFYGAASQAFRRAEPAWKATVTAIVVIPAIAHTVEFLIHWLRGTPNLRASIGASVAFTILSTLFNLYIMRRGAMVVGAEGESLFRDMRRMPRLIGGFLWVIPKFLYDLCRRILTTRPGAQ